ncbi:MAG: hypothetical protein J7M25_05680 [Deltaproteobacteria bacterium]|nr:hypothetical protein [Deltaproteobacteria bacterium]
MRHPPISTQGHHAPSHHAWPAGQRGFSLVIVFLILSLMAAAAMAVLLSTRTNVQVVGHERENAVAFYSAEAGLAYAKADLLPKWNSSTFWTPVLRTSSYTIGVTRDYKFGGQQGIPQIRANYTFRFSNNDSDPSASANTDSDGKIVITSVGRAFDSSGTRVIATVTLQMEVEWQAAASSAADYQAQSNQGATGSAQSTSDTGAVDMTGHTSL